MTNTEKITAIENKIRGECEWLKEGNEVTEALCGMYEQYCSGDGHMFMSAGEYAQIVLEKVGLLNSDSAGRGEIKWEKMTRGIQLSDLLYVLNKMKVRVAIDGEGMFLEKEFGGDGYYCAGQPLYDLTKSFKENLEQSPELVEFIYQLLIK